MVIKEKKIFLFFIDELDEEIKKCTKTCVEKVREGKGKINSPINQKNPENKKDYQSKKSESEEGNQKIVNPKIKEKEGEKNKEGECSYKLGNEEFCEKNFDPNAEDYRKRNVQTCKKYFCPLCCEKKTSGIS